jgi:hypothetical protein
MLTFAADSYTAYPHIHTICEAMAFTEKPFFGLVRLGDFLQNSAGCEVFS